jgi:pSer/pThr/pTyr-binding forkhead associated (FHA) protein
VWLLETANGAAPVTFRLSAGVSKTMGRAPSADFVLHAPLVSRVHCRLEASGDSLTVVDLASTNGTYVNGERIDRVRLKKGDRLRVGRVEFLVAQQA